MQAIWVRLLLLITSSLVAVSAAAESTTIISVNAQGQAANGFSDRPAISADGRFVAYESDALDLAAGDTNGRKDIFLYDLQTNAVTRVSVGANGAQSNNGSASPAISQDGRYVAFESQATNLVSNDTNISQDIFIHDRITATTVRVSVSSSGVEANGDCLHPAISGDGRFVVFVSAATNLAAGDTNTASDVFLHDRDPDQNGVFDENNGTTMRITSSGPSAVSSTSSSNFPSISRNGQYAAFSSLDSTLVPGDVNGWQDIFVYNIQTGLIELVSVSSSGQQGDLESSYTSLSADGRYVAFISAATNLVSGDSNAKTDVFVHDRAAHTTVRASVSNTGAQSGGASTNPVISGDGRYVSFVTESSGLTAKLTTDEAITPRVFDAITAASGGGGGGGTTIPQVIYRRDLSLQKTVRVSSNNAGSSANGSSMSLAMATDGIVAAFASDATNLSTVTDSNAGRDVFVRDMNTSVTAAATKSSGGGRLFIWTIAVLYVLYVFLRNRPLHFVRKQR